MKNRVSELFGIKYPIIQGGMVWHSGWELAAAVSNNGGLGLLAAGSMCPEELRENIQRCKNATDKPFGVNIPLLFAKVEENINVILEENVPIVFTSAGNPKTYTKSLQNEGIKVAHIVSSTKFAIKCEEAGVDAIVAEGFEAGGHNGRDETTTLCLIPNVKKHISKPLLAAGGIALGSQMRAVMCLGAEGVQIGSRFAATKEAYAHELWKEKITQLQEGDTLLTLKELAPTRLVRNDFFYQIEKLYQNGRNPQELDALLGKGSAKKGMLEGNLDEGELEIGQVSALIDEVLSVSKVFENLLAEFEASKEIYF